MKYKNGNQKLDGLQTEEENIKKVRSIGSYEPNQNKVIKDTVKPSDTNDSWYLQLLGIMLSIVFARWLFYYADFVPQLLILIAMEIFSTFCIIVALYLLIKKKFKKCVLLMLPVVLATLVGFTPINTVLGVPDWLRIELLAHSRHYVEFLIQKNIYLPEIAAIENGTEYKEWRVSSNTWTIFSIVFDEKDKVINKNGTSINGRSYIDNGITYFSKGDSYDVYKVGKHFYMVETHFEQ